MGVFLVILILLVALVLTVCNGSPFYEIEEVNRKKANKTEKFKTKFNIPKEVSTVFYQGKPTDFPCEFLTISNDLSLAEKEEIMDVTFLLNGLFVWVENGFLTFFVGPDLNDLDVEDDFIYFSKFSVSKIKCFYRQGDTYTDTKILGGGSSLGGAIVGGMIAGEAGAVIGSRQEIKSETKFIDKRSTILVIEDSSTSKDHFLIFDTNAYDVFLEIIPTKEKSYIEFNSNTSNTNNPTDDEQDVIDLLIKYKQLKDDGVITDEEFEKKKSELLNT